MVISKGEEQFSEKAEKEIIVARLAKWSAPLDLSIAPLFLLIAIIPNAIVDFQSGNFGSNYLIKLFFIKFSALLIWLTILKLIKLVIFKQSYRDINLFILGIIGFLVGAVAGTYVHFASEYFGLPLDNTTLLRRVISTAVVGFSWLPVAVILSSSFNRLRHRSSGIEDSTNTKVRQNFKNSGYYQSYIGELNLNIEKKLISITNKIRKKLISLSPDPDTTLNNIDKIVEILETKELRNLSNEIANKITLRKKNFLKSKILNLFNFSELVLVAIFKSFKTSALNPRIFTYIITICTVAIAIRRNHGIVETLEFGLFAGVLTFIFSFAKFKIWELKSKFYFLSALILVMLNIFAPLVIIKYLNRHHIKFAEMANEQTFPFLWTALILVCLLFGHMGNASINSNRNIFNFNKFTKLVSEIEGDMIRDQENLINHKWAVHIHGKIQTRLSTSVLAIRQSLEANDREGVLTAIDSIQQALQVPNTQFAETQRDLQSEVTARLAPWKGFLSSDLIIDPLLDELKGTTIQIIGDVVEEILSNSSRHGRANEIRLEIRRMGRKKILIRAEDNSVDLAPEHQIMSKGVGTSIFNAASDGRWSLRRDFKRAKTVFEMRIDASTTDI
jgi:two-component sensor histidine kinase